MLGLFCGFAEQPETELAMIARIRSEAADGYRIEAETARAALAAHYAERDAWRWCSVHDHDRPFSGRRTHYGDPLTAITAMTHEEKAQAQVRASYGLPVTSNGTTMLRNPAPHNDAANQGLARLSGTGTLSSADLRQHADEAVARAMRMTW
jgi:uncharacterized protein YhjY with autotransporter beta-barrel domain